MQLYGEPSITNITRAQRMRIRPKFTRIEANETGVDGKYYRQKTKKNTENQVVGRNRQEIENIEEAFNNRAMIILACKTV